MNLKKMRSFFIFSAILFLSVTGLGAGTRLCLSIFFHPFGLRLPAVSDAKQKIAESDLTRLNLPILISRDSLKDAAEKNIPKKYTGIDDDPTDLLIDDTLIYDINRGKISLTIKEGKICFSFPVKGKVSIEGKVNLGVTEFKTSAHADVAGIISGSLSFEILPDFQIKPHIDFRVEIKKASIPVKRLGKISLRSFLEKRLTKKIAQKKRQLIKKLIDNDIGRSKIKNAWEKIHMVRRVNEKPPVWVKVVPQKIGIMPLAADSNKTLKTGIELKLKTEIEISDTIPSIRPAPLPDAKILKKISKESCLVFPVTADMKTLNRFLEKRITGKEKKLFNNFIINFNRAEIISSEDNKLSLIIFLNAAHKDFGLKTKGRFYLHGRIIYNQNKGEIRFAPSGYDAAFSRWWASAINWIFFPRILYELDRRLVFSLNKEIEKADRKIEKWVKGLVVPPGIRTFYEIKAPEITELSINRGKIFSLLKIEGSLILGINLHEIKTLKSKGDN